MAAAIACKEQGQKVLLIDKQSQMGRKILVTGNGKCNLTNFAQKEEYYRSELSRKSAESTVCVWAKRSNGIVPKSWNLYKG